MKTNGHTAIARLIVALTCVGAGSSWAEEASGQGSDLAYPHLLNYNTRAKLSLISEGDRRLGTRPDDSTRSDELAMDLKPEWVWQLSRHWRSKLRLQAFGATGRVDVTDEIGGTETDGFVGLREFWFDYNGLTDYPGESIRFGRERLKEDTGLWWDDDVSLIRWIFDTTLLKTTVGVANKVSEMRTDIGDPPVEERSIARVFGQTRWQWRKDQYLTFLATHAERYSSDQDLADEASDGLPGRVTDSLTWASVRGDNAYFDWHSHSRFQYLASVSAVTGTDSRLDTNGTETFNRQQRNVSGWAADLGLRAQLHETPRWTVGMHGAIASGGSDSSHSDAFRQTGLESNRSRYTGTRSQVARFGEAFQPEWSNLRVATAYTALSNRDDWAANFIYHRYWMDDQAGTVYSDLIEPGYTGASDDIGQSFDIVLGYYGDDGASNWHSFDVRLRGGVFMPGDAFGPDASSNRHRVVLDVAKRF